MDSNSRNAPHAKPQAEKKKFPHDKSKILFFETFLQNSRIFYFIQC